MTFLDLQQNVYRKVGFADSPSTEVSTRIKMYLNEVHRRVLGLPGMDYFRTGLSSFATVASMSRYGMPYDVGRILAIRDETNDVTLRAASLHWYLDNEADPDDDTGNPEVWVPVGYGPLRLQPANSSTVYAISSSAGDIQALYIEGISGGNLVSTSVTLTGATKKSLGTWSQINKLYLASASAGTIDIWEDDVTTGTLLGTLPIGKTGFRYYNFALWPTPSSAITLSVDYMRVVADMSNNTDEPLIPEGFHWVLAAGARMLEWEKQDDSRWQAAKGEYEKGIRDLKWFVHTQASAGLDQPMRGSRLGPWYPAGS